jgi:hypothetical protein
MSNTTTKTRRLGGAAGYSVHGVQALTEGKPTYRRSLGLAQTHPVYTRVELWKDAEDEANVLCSLPLDAKRKDILCAFRTWLPASMSAEDVKFLCGLVRTAYAQRALS